MKVTALLPVFLGSLLLAASHCKKNKDQLPSATQSGANTFGCLIDGKAWIPTGHGAGSGIEPTSGGFFGTPDGKRNIYIKAYSPSDDIHIFLKQVYTVGTYYLNKNNIGRPDFLIYPESYGGYFRDDGSYFVTDSLNTGVVRITYADTTSGIVSGTFQFTAKNPQTGPLKKITDGRFDYKTH